MTPKTWWTLLIKETMISAGSPSKGSSSFDLHSASRSHLDLGLTPWAPTDLQTWRRLWER